MRTRISRAKLLGGAVAAVALSIGIPSSTQAVYDTYCGTSTQYWSDSYGVQFKIVYVGSTPPSPAIPGGTIYYLYDRYYATQQTGTWVKYVDEEHHACATA